MRHAARVAAAAGRAGPARVAGLKEGAAGFATHAPAVVHPPQQSMRPAYTKEDRSHTEKWLQARGWQLRGCSASRAHARVARSLRRHRCARRRSGSPALRRSRCTATTPRAATAVRRMRCFSARCAAFSSHEPRRLGAEPGPPGGVHRAQRHVRRVPGRLQVLRPPLLPGCAPQMCGSTCACVALAQVLTRCRVVAAGHSHAH
jgi:hypothetical protein